MRTTTKKASARKGSAKKASATRAPAKKAPAKKAMAKSGSAKKATTKKSGQKGRKSASKRELIAPRADKRYIRRDAKGRIKESDDVSRSLSADRRRAAKTPAKKGQGDRGD